jgi:stearoyl-CoA desaturase (delta-9 desaturase)
LTLIACDGSRQHRSLKMHREPPPSRIDWTYLLLLGFAHAMALVGVAYLFIDRAVPQTLCLGVLWYVCCGLSITAGYHRLFSHRSYRAAGVVRALALLFAAASLQTSALSWCDSHRQHHRRTDCPDDPYDVGKGFLWAHVGWVVHSGSNARYGRLPDLEHDPLVMLQHRHYPVLAVTMGFVVPACIGALWGDALGGVLVAGFLRLVLQWHATFSVNSVAHTFGSRPYTRDVSARDNWFVAFVTFGEGYHNFHHRFPSDYRNGVRWVHFDPTKWCIWTLSKLRLTWSLRRTSARRLERAMRTVRGDAQGTSAVGSSIPAG